MAVRLRLTAGKDRRFLSQQIIATMKVIKENWEAIDALKEKLKEHTGDENGHFSGGFGFSNDGMFRTLMVKFHYTKEKANGSRTQKTYDTQVLCKFCPFTGKPLYQESTQKKDEA